jgi:hypothetical protein
MMRTRLGAAYWAGLFVVCHVGACKLDLAGDKNQPPPSDADDHDAAGSGAGSSGNNTGTSTAGNNTPSSHAINVSCDQVHVGDGADVPAVAGGKTSISGLIHITGDYNLEGSIEIAPGTTFVMAADSSLAVGDRFGGRATLTSHATADKPVRFCAEKPTGGYWHSLGFSSGLTSDSVAENWIVANAGGGSDATAVIVSATILLKNLTVQGSANDGISAVDFDPNSTGLTVSGSGRDAVVLSAPGAVDHFPSSSTFSNNTNNVVRLTYSRVESGSFIFRDLGVPYVQNAPTFVNGGAAYQFSAGVEYQFAADSSLDFGMFGSAATVKVLGTADAPVVFRGVDSVKGYWTTLTIEGSVSADSKLSHLQLKDGGGKGADPTLIMSASIAINDVAISESKNGVTLNVPLAAGSTNLSVTGVDSYPIVTNSSALGGIPTGGSFTGNAMDLINITSDGDLVGTIPNLGIPYRVAAELNFGRDSDLTIAPGSEFVFISGYKYGFQIGEFNTKAKLTAVGTASAPIIFRGEKDEAGSWNGISITGSASLDSRIDHVQVIDAGMSLSVAIPVTNSSFMRSPGYGIQKAAADTSDYATTNTFSDNAMGDIGNL